jgi:hypothetical protein
MKTSEGYKIAKKEEKLLGAFDAAISDLISGGATFNLRRVTNYPPDWGIHGFPYCFQAYGCLLQNLNITIQMMNIFPKSFGVI